MQKKWCENHAVGYSQFDREGNFKLHAWSNFLQEAAANHAAILGVGMNDLAKNDLLWVLAQIKVRLHRAPVPGEKIEVTTYPSGTRKLFANREFKIQNETGNLLLSGSSRWVLLSGKSMRPQSVLTIAGKLPDNSDLPVYFDFAEKLPVPENYDFFYDVPIRHSMEDVNGHLNNAEYLAAAQDALCSHGIIATFSGFEIAYHRAMRAPETLTVGIQLSPGGALFTIFNAQRERCVSGKLSF